MAGIAAATMSGMMLSASVFAPVDEALSRGVGVGAIIGATLSGAKGTGTVLRVRMDARLNLRR
jgi:hypothetical protein